MYPKAPPTSTIYGAFYLKTRRSHTTRPCERQACKETDKGADKGAEKETEKETDKEDDKEADKEADKKPITRLIKNNGSSFTVVRHRSQAAFRATAA